MATTWSWFNKKRPLCNWFFLKFSDEILALFHCFLFSILPFIFREHLWKFFFPADYQPLQPTKNPSPGEIRQYKAFEFRMSIIAEATIDILFTKNSVWQKYFFFILILCNLFISFTFTFEKVLNIFLFGYITELFNRICWVAAFTSVGIWVNVIFSLN